MQVYPAAGLLHYVQPTVPVYLIDPQDVKIAYQDVYHIKGHRKGWKNLTIDERTII